MGGGDWNSICADCPDAERMLPFCDIPGMVCMGGGGIGSLRCLDSYPSLTTRCCRAGFWDGR